MVTNDDPLLTPGEVARMFRVDPKTVTRWALAGKMRCLRTPGGHRRFYRSTIEELLRDENGSAEEVPEGDETGPLRASGDLSQRG